MVNFFIERKSGDLTLFDLEQLLGKEIYCDNLDEKSRVLQHEMEYYLGVVSESGRGFGFSMHPNEYEVMVNTPSTIEDWNHALKLLSELSKRAGNTIICGENTYTSETIYNFNFKDDINNGLKMIYDKLSSKEAELVTIIGLKFSQVIDEKLIKEVFEEENTVEYFSDYVKNTQWIDAEISEQNLLGDEETGEIHSLHVICSNVPTIVPFKNIIDISYSYQGIEPKDINKSKVIFIDDDSKLIGEIEQEKLEEILQSEMYQKIDSANIFIRALTTEEIKQALDRA